MKDEPKTFTIRGHELVAVNGSWNDTIPIRGLAVDMGLPKTSCAFCPGYVSDVPLVAHDRCSWDTLCVTMHPGKAYRFVPPDIWAIIKLRS